MSNFDDRVWNAIGLSLATIIGSLAALVLSGTIYLFLMLIGVVNG